MNKYLDSNIFIYPLLYNDKKSKIFKKILLDLSKGIFRGFTSILTWDELVHVLRKKRGLEISKKEGRKFLSFPNLTFLDSNLKIGFYAQRIMERYGAKPRDSIHIATALGKGIKEVISDDSDFDKIKEIKRIRIG